MRSPILLFALVVVMGLASANAQAHWTYPRGSIASHLQLDHGVNTAGMSQEQMLSHHDAIHEGAVVESRNRRSRAVKSAAPVRRVFGRLFR